MPFLSVISFMSACTPEITRSARFVVAIEDEYGAFALPMTQPSRIFTLIWLIAPSVQGMSQGMRFSTPVTALASVVASHMLRPHGSESAFFVKSNAIVPSSGCVSHSMWIVISGTTPSMASALMSYS